MALRCASDLRQDRSPFSLWYGAVPLWARAVIVSGGPVLFLMRAGGAARL
ncbi:MAG TPA: hypothetical protein VGR27_03435 [Longimicrobiaceae bacterium]|nr:hypothetical protein [Longimicrobiaceae bacterium]